MQQSYAKRGGVTDMRGHAHAGRGQPADERGRPSAATASRWCATSRRCRWSTVDKHKVLQILVNLIRNAKYACDESASGATSA